MQKPRLMKGGEAIVNSLLSHNVDTFFGLPGVQTYEIFDALYTHSDKVTLYVPKHEQTAGYMAYGYAKSGAGAGIFSVVPGPGVLNAGAALCTAQGASAPVMCITGQVPSGFLGKGYGHLHELPDQLATVGSFTKSARRIEHGAQAPALVNDAFEQMTTGRPGAVHLEMTWDELSRTSSVLISESGIHERSVAIPEAFDVENAIELIKESKFPMLFVGGGATGACEEIQELANLLEIPVVAHRAGRGVVSESEDLGLFGYAGRLLWEHVDLVIAIGTRLEMPYLRWQQYDRYSPRPSYPKLVRIDIDPMEHVRWPADVAITADAKVAVAALLSEVKAGGIASFRLAAAARKAKEIAKAQMNAQLAPQMELLSVIRRVLPKDGFFVDELCQLGFASWNGFPIYEPRTFVSSGPQGTLGSGFPTALGVKAAHPERAVVSVTGDGGFMFAAQELVTAATYKLGVVVVLINNGGFANVRRDQELRFESRVIAADFDNPDFQAMSNALGVQSSRVRDIDQFESALKAAMERNEPWLIEVVVDRGSEPTPWPFIHPAKSLESVSV